MVSGERIEKKNIFFAMARSTEKRRLISGKGHFHKRITSSRTGNFPAETGNRKKVFKTGLPEREGYLRFFEVLLPERAASKPFNGVITSVFSGGLR